MNKLNSRTISINALAIALVCLSTMFLQFPIPLGYAHLGNCFILISGVFFGPVTGLLAGGIGSALSDLLTGYAQWIIPTLIIKGIMGFVIGYIANRTGLTVNMFKIRTAAASIVGTWCRSCRRPTGSAISSAAPFFTAASIPVRLRFRALLWKALSASFSSMSSVPLCRLHICQSIFSGSLSVSRMYLFQERN